MEKFNLTEKRTDQIEKHVQINPVGKEAKMSDKDKQRLKAFLINIFKEHGGDKN